MVPVSSRSNVLPMQGMVKTLKVSSGNGDLLGFSCILEPGCFHREGDRCWVVL